MVKTRIIVLQMKEIIRTAIFAVIGLALIIFLIWAIIPSGGDADARAEGPFVPGTYTSYIIIHNRPISVVVTVDETYIVGIELLNMAETQEVFYPLIRPTLEMLSRDIIRYQTTAIDPPLEVAVTSRILLEAVNNALAQAKVTN